MDAEGTVLATHEGPREIKNFAETGAKARSVIDLQKRAAGGDEKAKIELFVLQVEMGSIPYAKAVEQAKSLKLSDEQRKKLDAQFLNLEVMELVNAIDSQEGAVEAGKKLFTSFYKAKRIPTGEEATQAFWGLILTYGDVEKDVAAFEAGVAGMKKQLADEPRAKKFLEDLDKKLEEMKSGKSDKDEDPDEKDGE